MKKTLTVQPKNLRQTLHFWLRRPDYGWTDLWHGNPLTVEPFEGRLEHTSHPRARWCIRQKVRGMDSTVYLPIDDIEPSGFSTYELPSDSWWRNEGRSMVMDYLRFGARNAPTAHALVALALLVIGFLYLITQDPSGRLAFMEEAEIPRLARILTFFLLGTPVLSLLVNHLFPSRNYLTVQFYRAEAWLLLLTALAAAPGLPKGLRDFRAKVLAAADLANEHKVPFDQRDPASR